MGGFPPTALAGVVGVDGLLAQHGGQLLEGSRFLAAQEDGGIHVADDGIGVVLVDSFQLGLRLQYQTGGDLTAADGGDQFFQLGNLADVGTLVNEAAHMDRQPPAVHIVRLFTQEVEQLGVAHGDQEVKAIVRVAHNEEQGGFPVSQGIQLQLVVGRDLPQLRNVEHGKARTAGNQNGFCGFARSQLIFFILADSEVARITGFQLVEHQVNGVFVFLVILPNFHAVYHLDEGGEVLLLNGGLIVDVPNQGTVQQCFRFDPKIVPGLSLALGVGYQRGNQLQNVLLRVDVGKGVIVHGLLEVDGVEDLYPVRLIDNFAALILHGLSVLIHLGSAPLEHLAALHQDGAFWSSIFWIEKGYIADNF